MLTGEKISLRPFTRADLELFERLANDAAYLSEYNQFGLNPSESLQSDFTQSGLLDSRTGMLVIVLRESDTPIGEMSYHLTAYGPNEASRVYNIGLTLLPEQRGKGYGVEAQKLLADYLFRAYPIQRVEATTDITNLAEQRALEKAGFTREGVLRQVQWRNGAWHDLVVYSKLRGE